MPIVIQSRMKKHFPESLYTAATNVWPGVGASGTHMLAAFGPELFVTSSTKLSEGSAAESSAGVTVPYVAWSVKTIRRSRAPARRSASRRVVGLLFTRVTCRGIEQELLPRMATTTISSMSVNPPSSRRSGTRIMRPPVLRARTIQRPHVSIGAR
jgi:hypothetical protein